MVGWIKGPAAMTEPGTCVAVFDLVADNPLIQTKTLLVLDPDLRSRTSIVKDSSGTISMVSVFFSGFIFILLAVNRDLCELVYGRIWTR